MNEAARTTALATSAVPSAQGWRRLRAYAMPLVFLLTTAPLTIYAVARSVEWIGTTFPGFLLMENRVVPSVSGYDWPSGKLDIVHAQVVAVDGVPVSSSAAVYELASTRPPGTVIEYTFRRAGKVFQQPIAVQMFRLADYLQIYGILLLIGCLNLVLGCAVGFMQPHQRPARVYVLLSLAGCWFAVTPVFLHRGEFTALTGAYLLAESFFPATFVHFALCFPLDRLAAGRSARRWLPPAYGLALVLALVKLAGFHSDPPNLAGFYATYLYIAASFAIFLALLWAARRSPEPSVQLRIRTLIPIVTIGATLAIFAFMNNAIAGGDFPMQLGLLVVPIFFGSIAYGIVAHDLFGIDRFVRWSFVYAGLSLMLYATYALIVAVTPVANLLGGDSYLLLGLGFVSVALVLDPLRRLIQRLVDRTYYRTPWSYRDTVSRVSRQMTTWRSVERIVDELSRVLTNEMQLEAVSVCLLNDAPAWFRAADAPLRRIDQPRAIRESARIFGDGREPILASDFAAQAEGADLPAFFDSIHAALVLPLTFADRLTGIIVLGATRARRPLYAEDLDLLCTLSDQAAIAIENALSYESLEAHNRNLNETVRQRTAQLIQSEQLASLGQLVAGVAHELNNPVGAVYSGVENLRTHVDALEQVLQRYQQASIADASQREHITREGQALGVDDLLEDTRTLLDICTEGSERVRGIVRDLLTFARSDRGERQAVVVCEGLDSTVRLLADRLERARVRVVKDYQPIPAIEASAAQLNQVWMNLLTNAIDALEARVRAEIDISVRDTEEADWAVEIVVSDNGSGMSEEVRARIFEPFFSTKEIGKGTGLGMSIAYGAIRDHGGTIEIHNRAGGGTTVRVRLPRSAAIGGARL